MAIEEEMRGYPLLVDHKIRRSPPVIGATMRSWVDSDGDDDITATAKDQPPTKSGAAAGVILTAMRPSKARPSEAERRKARVLGHNLALRSKGLAKVAADGILPPAKPAGARQSEKERRKTWGPERKSEVELQSKGRPVPTEKASLLAEPDRQQHDRRPAGPSVRRDGLPERQKPGTPGRRRGLIHNQNEGLAVRIRDIEGRRRDRLGPRHPPTGKWVHWDNTNDARRIAGEDTNRISGSKLGTVETKGSLPSQAPRYSKSVTHHREYQSQEIRNGKGISNETADGQGRGQRTEACKIGENN